MAGLGPQLSVSVEGVLYALRDYLVSNYPTQISALTALVSSPLPTLTLISPTSADYLIGADDFDPESGFPNGIGISIQAKEDAPVSIASGMFDLEILILVGLDEPTGEKQNLASRLLRYARALRQCFYSDPTCGGYSSGALSIVQAVPGRCIYGQALAGVHSPLYSVFALSVIIRFQENR